MNLVTPTHSTLPPFISTHAPRPQHQAPAQGNRVFMSHVSNAGVAVDAALDQLGAMIGPVKVGAVLVPVALDHVREGIALLTRAAQQSAPVAAHGSARLAAQLLGTALEFGTESEIQATPRELASILESSRLALNEALHRGHTQPAPMIPPFPPISIDV